MTNNWSDLGNATLFVVMGANPAENHPASIAHINRARTAPPKVLPGGGTSNKPAAKLIVIDPRKTRTALQADMYVRIRPGTDIAFINGLIREILVRMEEVGGYVPAATKANFFSFLNDASGNSFFTDGGDVATGGNSALTAVPGGSKYTDARHIIASSDYVRGTWSTVTNSFTPNGTETPNQLISNLPRKAATVTSDPNTVYNRLKAHVAAYTLAEVANICGCSEAEIQSVASAYIENARCSSYDPAAPGTIVANPTSQYFRSTNMMYAMGLTQHTCGAQNVNSFATLQSLLGNMGRAGGGINALRGIHNVQGSTDMGVLYGNIPAYSGNPTVQPATDANAFGKYMDELWGTPVNGTGGKARMNDSYDDAYRNDQMALQQRGFYNMTLKWFGDYAYIDGLAAANAYTAAKRAAVDAAYSLWPKGQGHHHIKMFEEMRAGRTKAAVVWGQNPCITEANQSHVRDAFYNLDLLVVTDIFENETAACDRKPNSTTYLLPSCSHIEKAGSSANSGRVLQWRYKSLDPVGNSKDDTELLLRFAKALADAGAFNHLELGATVNGIAAGEAYAKLYGTPYGYTPGVNNYADVSMTAEMATLGKSVTDPTTYSSVTVTGGEAVAEKVYQEMCTGVGAGGTIWIYTNGYSAGRATNKHWNQADWGTANRAKSRDKRDPNNTLAFPGWGYAWLVNRRVLYNNNADNPGTASLTGTSTSEVPGDVNDFFMSPDSNARIFTSHSTLKGRQLNYSRWYRFYHRLLDMPKLADGSVPSIHVHPARFNSHTEPYESPRPDLVAKYGQNSTEANHFGTGALNLKLGHTQVGSVANFPLVLTTIRCVEHFQGGPITRNNAWNVEIEPEPWIEINSVDARKYGIADGDWVKVVTARTEAMTGDSLESLFPNADYGQGFRARVGVGADTNQRTGKGVVAIPWHWGEKGLSTGSRANDVTIDAFDANTTIPEFKACLCRIEKM